MSAELFLSGEPGATTALLACACPVCRRVEFPRRESCPACGADAAPIQLSGPAVLRVCTSVRAQPPGSLIEAPYGVGVAEFSEGLCVIGLLIGEPTVGATVDVVVHEPYLGGRIFAFREQGPHE